MNTQLPRASAHYRRGHKLLGPGLHKLDLSCRHYSELTVLSMDRPLTAEERLRHFLHYCLCGICRQVTRQMKSLRAIVRASVAESENEKPDPAFLESLRLKLTKIAGEPDTTGKTD